jgi:GR25 family glycosyltransferase involved in LPS biosynthesis
MKYKIWYINLDERTDRKEKVEQELKDAGFTENEHYVRLSAIKHVQGAIGCAMSHIECLKHAMIEQVEYAVIIEDDFIWKEPAKFAKQKIETAMMKYDFDVFLLAASMYGFQAQRIDARNKFIHKIISAQTTTGYIIAKKYIPKLLNNFENAVKILEQTGLKPLGAIDVTWKQLQAEDNWMMYIPGLAKQSAGFSDIEGVDVDYPFV